MLLAVDIGNTGISLGLFKKTRLVKKASIVTKDYSLKKIKTKLGKACVDDIVICSVVPGLTGILKKDLTKIFSAKARIVGRDISVPIKNLYRKPNQVGQDRLVNAYAATKLFKAPMIIVDFGTAITFDLVSKKGEYLGGIIAPGIKLSLDSLVRHAALLPRIRVEKPKALVGKDTASSMNSGIVYGTSCLVDGLVTKLKQDFFAKNVLVIATGGCVKFLTGYCRLVNKVDPYLTLKGIQFLSAL